MATLTELISEFIADVSRRCAKATVIHYGKRLSSFRRDLGDKLLSDLNSAIVKEHVERESKWSTGDRAGQLKAPDTIRGTVVAWEQCQKWMIDTGRLAQPITEKLPKPGGRKREEVPTDEETKLLVKHSSEEFRPMYLALRLTGARPSEICKAKITDLNTATGVIVLVEHKTAKKTGKPRRIPVAHKLLTPLITAAIGDRTEGPIFLRSGGRPWTPEALSECFRDARQAAGVRREVVLYAATRHFHATKLWKATKDIKCVADALGHTNIITASRYAHTDDDTLKANQQLFNDAVE